MKHYLSHPSSELMNREIAAHRARLAELRSQRPFRAVARPSNIVSIAAARRVAAFPLVGLTRGVA